jgi:hypothetical protein
LPLRSDLTGALCQVDEHLHRLGFELDALVTAFRPVERRAEVSQRSS